MQLLAGSQLNPQQQVQTDPGMEFLNSYKTPIEEVIKKLQNARIPDSFAQNVNGQIAQNLIAHKEDYV